MTIGEHENRYQTALKLLKLKTTERKYSDQKKRFHLIIVW